MLRSLFSGVAGLTTHQTKLDVIGNNIANVNTYGFKASRVTFSDVYYQTTKAATGASDSQGGVNSSQIGYGSTVSSIDKMMSQSAFASTSNTLDVAISGEGFIQVQDKTGNKFFTRAGMMNVDSEGNLVDSKGYFVLGTQNYDPTSLASMSPTAGNSKINIKVPDVHIAETDPIALDAAPSGATGATVKAGFINGDQTDITLTIKYGGAAKTKVTGYDSTATPATLEVTISDADKAKIANGGTVGDLQDKINQAIEAELGSPTLLDTNGVALFTEDTFKGGKITLSIDTSEVTGTLTPDDNKALQQDAIAKLTAGALDLTSEIEEQSFADLSSFYISGDGTLVGVHAVHGMLYFGRMDLATFDNPQGLNETGSSYFQESAASGSPKYCIPGYEGSGAVVSGSLEMSNVNLATEFSDLITTQRGFQANSRIITTSDSILEELVNLKR
ncbi:MAG: flagellar hook protein FlgE [Oscillospiraceae bacterium]